MVSLSVGLYAACSAPYFLLVEAEVRSWPRPVVAAVDRVKPVVWSAARSASVYPLLREWDNVRHFICEACRDAVALVVLLTTSPKGAMA